MIARMNTALAPAASSTFGHDLNPAQLQAATFGKQSSDGDAMRGAAPGRC